MATRAQIEAGKAVIVVDIKNMMSEGLKSAEKQLQKFASKVGQIGFDLFRGGLLGSIPVFGSLNEFTKFQDEILRLGTKLQTTDKQLKAVEATIRSLGKTTSFTALEVAQGATSLAQAGLTPTEVQSGLQAVLDLGRGARITLDESADLLANTSKTFKLPTSAFDTIASQFVAAARLSTIEVTNLKESIKEVSGTLNDLNVDLPTSLALINQLGFRSLKGTKAGTTLNTMLLNFVARSKQIAKAFGVDLTDKNGGIRNIVEVLEDFGKATQNLLPADRARLSQFLFNIRGARGETAVRDIEAIVKMAKEIRNAGQEARQAAIKMDSGLGGSIRRATSAVNDLAISLGEKLAPTVEFVLDLVPALAASIDQIVQKFPQMTVAVLAFPPAILAVGAGMLALSFTLSRLASLLGVFTGLASGVAGAFQNLGGTVSNSLNTAATIAVSKLREIDKAVALSLFGSGRGKRKRPKSIFSASIPFAKPSAKVLQNLAANTTSLAKLPVKSINSLSTAYLAFYKNAVKTARVSQLIKAALELQSFGVSAKRVASLNDRLTKLRTLQKSLSFRQMLVSASPMLQTFIKLGTNVQNVTSKLFVLTKQLKAAQTQAKNAATFIAANTKAITDRSKIYLMLEQNILALKKKQVLSATLLANAQSKVAQTTQRALLYKKFLAIERAYQNKVASISKQAARKQRLYGKPFLAKDAKELAALGKQRGQLLKILGKDTTIAKAIPLGQFWQVQAALAVKSLERVRRAAALVAKQTQAIPSLQALQARGFAQGARLTQEIKFLTVQYRNAIGLATKLSNIRLATVGALLVSGGKGLLGGAANLGKSTSKAFLNIGKLGAAFLLRGLSSGLSGLISVDWISKISNSFIKLLSIVRGFFSAGIAFGKFLFSFNGLFQLSLLLVAFGDNLRFTKGILDSFRKGFGEIGKSFVAIAKQSQFAFGQIYSGIKLVFAGEGGIGVESMAAGLMNLSKIITNNLLAGMNKFIEAIGPGLDYIYALFAGIWELLKQVGRTIGTLLSPLQEIGKTGGTESWLSDALDTVFSPKTVAAGVALLGTIVEGLGVALAKLLEYLFTGLSNVVEFLTRTIYSFMQQFAKFAERTIYSLPTDANRQALNEMKASRDSVLANGLTLAVDLGNISKEMAKAPDRLRDSTMKMNEALDQIVKDADGGIASRAAQRTLQHQIAAKEAANQASLSNIYNNTIYALETLGDTSIELAKYQKDMIYGFDGLIAQFRDFGNTFLGADLNRELGNLERMFNNLFAGPQTLSATKKQTLLGQAQQLASAGLKAAGDKAAAALKNPKQALAELVGGVANAARNPVQGLLDIGRDGLANGAAAIAEAIAKDGKFPDNIKGLYGAVVGSFQETKGRLLSAKSETEKQTDLLQNISSGLHRGNTPYLQSIDDKISEPEFV